MTYIKKRKKKEKISNCTFLDISGKNLVRKTVLQTDTGELVKVY